MYVCMYTQIFYMKTPTCLSKKLLWNSIFIKFYTKKF